MHTSTTPEGDVQRGDGSDDVHEEGDEGVELESHPSIFHFWHLRLVRNSFLIHIPGLMKFCRTHLLAAPTSFEEPLLDTSITVIVDEEEQVLSVLQEGIGPEEDVLKECLGVAKRRRREIKI